MGITENTTWAKAGAYVINLVIVAGPIISQWLLHMPQLFASSIGALQTCYNAELSPPATCM